jgi:hypothetical protein
MIKISDNAYHRVRTALSKRPVFTGKMEEWFDAIEEVYGELIPQQDLSEGTYEWVCTYAGSKFYVKIEEQKFNWFS